ncbi:HAF repeat-containing protein [Telluria beijingensis]|uniref:HAF repeat-containing protein n=1 Tax=Telluria beijingensis TaxID=3068633 RepID=UPI002795CE18|nr:HAF repeat-containing protein [Massilia sp. REN29]
MLQHLGLALASFAVAGASWAYPEYRVTIVGPANSTAADINSTGAVVGRYQVGANASRGFVNRGKGVVVLGPLGGGSSNAVAINDKGEVLGNWTGADGRSQGYLYACGKQRNLGAIYGNTYYIDINNAGYIVGRANPPGTIYPLSVLRVPNGSVRDLGSIATEDPTTQAYAINNRNQVAAESGPWGVPEQPFLAVIWTKGKFRDLGGFGWEPNRALAINDRGQATGYASVTTGGPHDRVAFFYSNGRLVNIDPSPANGLRFSEGKGINNHAHIVGNSDQLGGFIWRGNRMQSLSKLIDPKLGWTFIYPEAINDAGQNAASAVRNGVQYAVRLDLSRPYPDAAPTLDAGEAAEVAALAAPSAQEAAQPRVEAAAQAREVALPVAQ